jgi:hypothetical protein
MESRKSLKLLFLKKKQKRGLTRAYPIRGYILPPKGISLNTRNNRWKR